MKLPGRNRSGQQREGIEKYGRERIPYVEEYYDLLGYEVDPLGGFRLCRNQRLPHISINQHGYRGKSLDGSEKVLLLGDSVTFGVGASGDHACFSRFLEAPLGHQVADASVRAYRVCQHFSQLPRLLDMLPTLHVVLLWCGYADLLFWASTGGCVEGAFQFERKYRSPAIRQSPAWAPKSIMSLVGRVRRKMAQLDGEPEARARETGDLHELVDHIVTYIGAIRDLCFARGIKLELLLQPFLRTRPADPYLRRIADFYDTRVREKCGVGWYEAAPKFISELIEMLNEKEKLRILDCQAFISEADFLDQVHLKEQSLERMARDLVEIHHLCRVAIAGDQAEPVAVRG